MNDMVWVCHRTNEKARPAEVKWLLTMVRYISAYDSVSMAYLITSSSMVAGTCILDEEILSYPDWRLNGKVN